MKILRISFVVALIVLNGQAFTANAQTLTYLHFFTGSPTNGDFPLATLVEGNDGNYYGTTEFGGSVNSGTVFRISSSGTYTSLHSFTNSPDGNIPMAGLVQGSDGNLYGTTSAGGTNGTSLGGFGTIFRISPSGTYTSLYSFAGPLTDGNAPFAALVEGADSNFYGTTYGGGTMGQGTVFQFSPDGVETPLYSFPNSPSDGAGPHAGLVLGSDGNFYGTTYSGGTNSCGCGTVFRIGPSGTYTSLYSFAGIPDGMNPLSVLVEGADSNFYGTTLFGGNNVGDGYGTVFRISPSGTYTSLYSFAGYPGGALPQDGLILGSDSNFYGTTESGGGGDGGLGTIFRMTPSGVVTTLYTFVGGITNGSAPYGALILGSDGDFYGTTVGGGPVNDGCVFKFTVASGGGGGGSCTYSIGSTNAAFDAAGGADSVSVIASNGCAWTAMSEDPSFITVTSGNSGSGNGTVHYIVAANTNTTSRMGTIVIQDQTLTITQSGASAESCTYTLAKTSITLTAKGGSKNASVKVKGTDCAWTAVSNDPFITITSGSNYTGSGKVDFTVPGNTNTTALTGTMTIAGQTFTVDQDAGGCTFKLSPKDGKFKAVGGTGTVKVTPNLSDCEWTAISTDSFITITSGASGTGKGSVTYTVPANATSNILTGSMTVAGETFTVIQAGVK
jgi:uncharacterized repeat protein (TIGR03803 family)